jgi:hypothetical protein
LKIKTEKESKKIIPEIKISTKAQKLINENNLNQL